MVLYRFRVTLANDLAKLCDHFRFVIGTGGFECHIESTVIAKSNQEDPSTMRVKRGSFQIELQAVQILKSEAQKIDPARLHKILFDRTYDVIGIREFAQAFDLTTKPLGCPFEQLSFEKTPIPRAEEITIGTFWPIENIIADR